MLFSEWPPKQKKKTHETKKTNPSKHKQDIVMHRKNYVSKAIGNTEDIALLYCRRKKKYQGLKVETRQKIKMQMYKSKATLAAIM